MKIVNGKFYLLMEVKSKKTVVNERLAVDSRGAVWRIVKQPIFINIMFLEFCTQQKTRQRMREKARAKSFVCNRIAKANLNN